MRGDPFTMSARFASACACGQGGHAIKRGDTIFYYPKTRSAFVGSCAIRAMADFRQNVAFEEDISAGYSGGDF